ncbi:ammonium transmembrane transporter [Aureococcus anophagefferens]|nr:ammonium transmembrane transporter [Aureococcus anophagefferens]
MNFTNEELEFLDARYAPASVAFALDTHWVLYCGVLVLLMQAGFAMLCAGSIRAKNAQNILLKNLLDLCVGALSFWATGYAFAYGGPGDGSRGSRFVGSRHFFLSGGFGAESHGFKSWFFQFAFAATSATIVSGAVAERCALARRGCVEINDWYAGYSAFLAGFVWPVVAHWVWSDAGWLSPNRPSPLFGVGAVDFAGSGVVHMVGGAAGIAARVLGPRLGRFEDAASERGVDAALIATLRRNTPIRGHSMPLVVLGTFLLWIGWGLLYGGDGSLLGAQAVAFGAIALWVGATMGPFFLLFRRSGALRVSMDEEIDGLDDAHHGRSAYEMDTFLDAELGKSDLDRISEVTDDANGDEIRRVDSSDDLRRVHPGQGDAESAS